MDKPDFTRRATIGMVAATTVAGATAAPTQPQEVGAREHVQGIGGFFFRAKDPKKLAEWYRDNLGIAPVPESYGGTVWHTEAGVTVFAPFEQDSTYFGDPRLQWMINFRVRDLDKMAAQLRAGGIRVDIDPQTYPNGRFAKLADPEGNPLQLWQPKDPG